MSTQHIPAELSEALKSRDSFIIAGHIRPDGDALGSTLALGLSLRETGKKVMMINEEPVPGNLAFLDCDQDIRLSSDMTAIPDNTVFIAVDTATRQRLGKAAEELLEQCSLVLNIDHHITNEEYGDINFIAPDRPATGAILYDLLNSLNLPVTPAVRDALYVAISTDTGSFQYKGTTARTLEIAAELIRLGVDVPGLNQKMYDELPWSKIVLTRAVLEHLNRTADGKIAYAYLTNEQKNELGAKPEDTEGMIDYLRSIKGVKVAAFIEEIDNDPKHRIRASLRSKDSRINVSEIACRFGGGGHPMAAGLRMPGPLEDARTLIIDALKEAVAQID